MAKIRVTRGGCGVNYTDEHGNSRHGLKTVESGPFECDDTQAARLVRLGVAAYMTEPQKVTAPDATQEPDPAPENITGHLSASALEGMSYDELKKLAADMGVKVEGKKKADYITAIAAAEVKAATEDDTEDGDDELPDLGAADPE